MEFYHTRCGGRIDPRKRSCLKCGKKWNPISFSLDPVGIRAKVTPIRGLTTPTKVPTSKLNSSYSTWADKLPSVGRLAGYLPKWPRWARILATIVVVAVIVGVVVILRR